MFANMASAAIDRGSTVSRRRRLLEFIRTGALSAAVLEELLADGQPLLYEKELWDYKLELPRLPNAKPSDRERQVFRLKMSEIVKDAVSFYNSL